MKRKILGLFVLLVIGITAFFAPPLSLSSTTPSVPSASGMKLMVIPLDDRPVNTFVPDKLAKSNGIELLLPPAELLGHFNDAGNSDEMIAWAIENAHTVDGFIISTDMLSYGGLVASRTMNTTESEAVNRLGILETLHTNYPDKPIYAYSSLLRLAPTVTNSNVLESYSNLREWAILKGKALSKKSDKWDQDISTLEKKISPDILASYIALRERNVAVNQKLVAYAHEGILKTLIFGQDDAAEFGLHQSEQEELASLIASKENDEIIILPGIDEVGTLLISRATLDKMNHQPNIYVVYDNPLARWWTPPMEDGQLISNIDRHIASVGARKTLNPSNADIYLFVKTPFTPSVSSDAFFKKLENYMDAGHLVMVADVAELNKSHAEFTEKLITNIDLNHLVSYSGWNTAGNSIGLTLGFGTMREAALASSPSLPPAKNILHTEHHLELLIRSFSVDYAYKTLSYPLMRTEASKNSIDEFAIKESTRPYEMIAENEINTLTNRLISNRLHDTPIYFDLQKKEALAITGVSDVSVVMPWKRFFEIEVSPDIQIEKQE